MKNLWSDKHCAKIIRRNQATRSSRLGFGTEHDRDKYFRADR